MSEAKDVPNNPFTEQELAAMGKFFWRMQDEILFNMLKDQMSFGTSFSTISAGGKLEHIPYQDVLKGPPAK